MHRRSLIRLVGLVVATALVASWFADAETLHDGDQEVSVPEDHSVVSIGTGDGVPPVEPGDLIDLYLSMGGFSASEAEISTPGEPSVVVSTTDTALTVAVPNSHVAEVATALSAGSVLVVRR